MRKRSMVALLWGLILPAACAFAQQSPPQLSPGAAGDAAELRAEVKQLRDLVQKLSARVSDVEARLGERPNPATAVNATPPGALSSGGSPSPQGNAGDPLPSLAQAPAAGTRGTLGLPAGTTVDLTVDGYYEYNFNHPVGRVNLLRAFDVSSNSFSLNQASMILERAPDPDAGRRFGARLDLQFGQATETLQGSAANELRPQVYRNIFQAYGTYVAPVGSGLTIDFGKWASALGYENNYTKDQWNYSRSYLFDFLPFYHFGARASYTFTPAITASYWVVNGAEQSEDFNGAKSQAIALTLKPVKSVSWNVNYYEGQEQPDVVAILNPGLPSEPTQPGLPVTPLSPAPDGRLHIVDSYATWTATPRLTIAGEADYVVNRRFSNSAPGHVAAGAAYARYQFTKPFSLAARSEYLSDRGGLFSGVSQALKETTLTADYRLLDGFLARWEWRRDFSNRPMFLTSTPAAFSQQQQTATIGLIWWWGDKQGAW